jgi:hypothetical protein
MKKAERKRYPVLFDIPVPVVKTGDVLPVGQLIPADIEDSRNDNAYRTAWIGCRAVQDTACHRREHTTLKLKVNSFYKKLSK